MTVFQLHGGRIYPSFDLKPSFLLASSFFEGLRLRALFEELS